MKDTTIMAVIWLSLSIGLSAYFYFRKVKTVNRYECSAILTLAVMLAIITAWFIGDFVNGAT